MYKKGAGNDKQGKDAGNRTLCPYRNFSQAIIWVTKFFCFLGGDYVAVRSETNDWFMCVISEINDPSKEVKARFMRKSGQYFLLSKKLEKWFPRSAIIHRCSVPSIDNRMRYSFDAIDIKGICDKIKTYIK